jgi:MATE efflux family protein
VSDKYTFLPQAPIHRVIGAMAMPNIISMLLSSMYNLVDTFFVGKINTQSTAAVGIVFSVMFFIHAFSLFWIFSNLE